LVCKNEDQYKTSDFLKLREQYDGIIFHIRGDKFYVDFHDTRLRPGICPYCNEQKKIHLLKAHKKYCTGLGKQKIRPDRLI